MSTPNLYAQALDDIRALRSERLRDAEPAPTGCGRCPGGRRGYQWHQRRGEAACESSLLANRAYMNAYQRSTGRTTRAGRRRGGERR